MSSSDGEVGTVQNVGKRKRTRIPAVKVKEWELTDDDETQLTQDDKSNRSNKKVRLSPQSNDSETKNNSKKSKYFSNSQPSTDEEPVVVQSQIPSQSKSYAEVETCLVCKTSFASFSLDA